MAVKKKAKIVKKKQIKKSIMDQQVKWVFIIAISIIILSIAVPYIFRVIQEEATIVEYEGLTFIKERFGQLTVYRYTYNFQDDQGKQFIYNLYVRNDPRENDVPVYGSDIVYPHGKIVYVSPNLTGIAECAEFQRELGTIANFITGNELFIRPGTPNEAEVNATDAEIYYANCETHPNNAVIILQKGDENKIEITGENDRCYVLETTSCTDMIKVVEKFEIQSVLDAKAAQEN